MHDQDHKDRPSHAHPGPSLRFRLGMVAVGMIVGAVFAPTEAEPVLAAIADTVEVAVE